MAVVWQSILIFNKHLEQRSALMLLKYFEMRERVDTARRRRRQLAGDIDKQRQYTDAETRSNYSSQHSVFKGG